MPPAASVLLREATFADGLRLLHKRYPSGLRMGRHAHAEWRFCLALRGSYTDSWRRGARTRTPWQLSLHPEGEVHTSVFHSAATCFHVEFMGRWRERLLDEAGIAPEPHEFLTGRVPLLAGQLFEEFRHDDACSGLVVEGLACELIGWAARDGGREREAEVREAAFPDAAVGSFSSSSPGSSPSSLSAPPSWVLQVRDLLHDRFNEGLSLREIAVEVDVHPVHLARMFKRQFGRSVGEYVRRLRVEFVCRELATGATLADLALRAGFADQSHLTRVFKRLTGRTPTQLRARR